MASDSARPARPPRRDFLPFSRPSLGEEEICEVVECLRSGWITSGPRVERFEQEFARRIGAPHAVAFSSGTAALHAAYWLLDLKPGDEVICPSLTWPSTATMARVLGARIVFADIDPETLQIDPADVARRRTNRTRAVVAVHFAGAPADLDALREAAGPGVALVEDAAHAVGTEYRGLPVGARPGLSVFSFHPIKNITTGEGGMLVTHDADQARRARLFRFHGISRDAWKAYGAGAALRYDALLPGFKYNLTDLAAGIGLRQLEKLDRFLSRRRAIAERYREGLADLPGLTLPRDPSYPHRHARHLFPVLVERRDRFLDRMRQENIGCGLHFEPVHRLTLYRSEAPSLPCAEAVGERIVSLPLFPEMSDGDVEDVIAAVRRTLRGDPP
ncbi:MAG TPA: aminotransferase class I/II-fold pyridoxal phosphate-dependent enzyme [Planctomycetota bacterium]|nr:aminotransferase class I/II-fold pyridoxal phosphate-dependent enzyme [Planctomycetota bacterium]